MTSGSSLETRLYDILAQPAYRPMKQHELARELHVKTRERAALRNLLRKGLVEGRLVCLRKNRWALSAKGQLIKARLSALPSGGAIATAIEPEGARQEYFIGRHALAGAIHGDIVLLESVFRRSRTDSSTRKEAQIVRVVERSQSRIAGRLLRNRFQWYVIPDHPHIHENIYISPGTASVELHEHHYVIVELDDWVERGSPLRGTVVEDIGDESQAGLSSRILLINHQLSKAFDSTVNAAARERAPELTEADIRGREDCRDMLTMTIDPTDARDFDDAISLVPAPEGWLLGVHIADVSHFVPIGSPIDREAAHRGNSVYLTGDFVPMLPHYLTSDVCSLRPSVDRLAYTVWLTLDERGAVLQHRVSSTVIRSQSRLTYEQVQNHFDHPESSDVPAHVRGSLDTMRALAQQIRQRRIKSGALNLEMPEVKCELDAHGNATAITLRGAPEAYQLIEEFMLLANVAVAERLSTRRIPTLYRIHEAPEPEQWEAMNLALHILGINEPVQSPADINTICRRMAKTPSSYLANLAILRNLKRAIYSSKRAGHFGLGFSAYTHFTSPIRRYPDLLIHRILKASEANARPPYRYEDIQQLAAHCSETERNADEAESESLKLKCLEYYAAKMKAGETGPYPALIVGVLARGLLIDLTESLTRGLIPLHALGSDYFEAFPDQGIVRSRTSKRQLRIGEVVEVELMRIDLPHRRIDFRLVSHAGSLRKGKSRDVSGSDRSSSARFHRAPHQKRGRSRGSS